MAAAALVACARGSPSLASRRAVSEILDSLDGREAIDTRAANNLFNRFTSGICNQPGKGRATAFRAVSAVSGDAENAQLLLRICRAVGRADGGSSARESALIEEISAVLNAPAPAVFDGTIISRDGKGPRPFFITIGNEKGGTGKSTTAMHLAVALLRFGYRVGSVDLDGRQGTLSRYLLNRGALAKTAGQEIPMPVHRRIEPSEAADRDVAAREETARLHEAFAELADRQIVVIDTPGSDSHLSRLGHSHADMLITPINDTLLDIDILAHIDPNKREVRAPSAYSEMVWEQSERRVSSGGKPIDWIVMRNRLTHINAHNKREIGRLLDQLAKRIGFRLASGFGERIIYHELFLTGLTVLDLSDDRLRGWNNVSLSHARQEISDLLLAIGVPETEVAERRL
jgi:chromosome partitioning protein